MHTGRFKLEQSTLAIGEVNGKLVAVMIPAGDTVKLIADPSPGSRMVDVSRILKAAKASGTCSLRRSLISAGGKVCEELRAVQRADWTARPT